MLEEMRTGKQLLPEFVKTLYGGLEEAPTTKRIHFQGLVQCFQQQRFSRFKEWLPTAHMEFAKDVNKCRQYALKSDTAVGDKGVVYNTHTKQPLTANGVLFLIAKHEVLWLREPDTSYALYKTEEDRFWGVVNRVLDNDVEKVGQLMNPSLRNFYIKTKSVWLRKARANLDEGCETDPIHSITHEQTATEEASPCNGRDECCCLKCCPRVYDGEDSPEASTQGNEGQDGSDQDSDGPG